MARITKQDLYDKQDEINAIFTVNGYFVRLHLEWVGSPSRPVAYLVTVDNYRKTELFVRDTMPIILGKLDAYQSGLESGVLQSTRLIGQNEEIKQKLRRGNSIMRALLLAVHDWHSGMATTRPGQSTYHRDQKLIQEAGDFLRDA